MIKITMELTDAFISELKHDIGIKNMMGLLSPEISSLDRLGYVVISAILKNKDTIKPLSSKEVQEIKLCNK